MAINAVKTARITMMQVKVATILPMRSAFFSLRRRSASVKNFVLEPPRNFAITALLTGVFAAFPGLNHPATKVDTS